jgi:hypothetical protein
MPSGKSPRRRHEANSKRRADHFTINLGVAEKRRWPLSPVQTNPWLMTGRKTAPAPSLAVAWLVDVFATALFAGASGQQSLAAKWNEHEQVNRLPSQVELS